MRQIGRYKIKSLEKALKILEFFDEKGKELSATQIHQRLGLSKSSVFRILCILEEANYLERNAETLRYKLGFKCYHLGSLVEGTNEIRQLALPFLEELVRKCDETVHLVVLDHGEALYVDKIEGEKAVRVVSRVGLRLPAHCSGVGKVLLAALPGATLEKIIRERGLPRFTNNTITDSEDLKAELARVRKRGYAIDNEEIEDGLKCVAAPVRNSNDQVIAAISISGPKERLTGIGMKRLVSMAIDTSEKISEMFKKRDLQNRVLGYP